MKQTPDCGGQLWTYSTQLRERGVRGSPLCPSVHMETTSLEYLKSHVRPFSRQDRPTEFHI